MSFEFVLSAALRALSLVYFAATEYPDIRTCLLGLTLLMISGHFFSANLQSGSQALPYIALCSSKVEIHAKETKQKWRTITQKRLVWLRAFQLAVQGLQGLLVVLPTARLINNTCSYADNGRSLVGWCFTLRTALGLLSIALKVCDVHAHPSIFPVEVIGGAKHCVFWCNRGVEQAP